MKVFRPLMHATVLLLVSAGIVGARPVRLFSYQELLDKSDLIVIAKPVSTQEKADQAVSPPMWPESFVGLSTEFDVSLVVKGDNSLKKIVLHHYRFAKPEDDDPVDGLHLVSFDPAKKKSYLLFLKKEADGRFAPINGQQDPGLCAVMPADNIDLIVIAKPVSAKKPVDKTTLFNTPPRIPLVGYQTEFTVQEVLKGDKSVKKFVLHHYERSGENMASMGIDFKPDPAQSYLLFLKKEADGRFAPITSGGGETTALDFPVARLGTARQ
ncbi:MAG: hypothetical protein ABSG78_23455 [Verrucomicrobiota bacterium]|jgi:hypothetical protein